MHKQHDFLKLIAMSDQNISFCKYAEVFLADKSMANEQQQSSDYLDHRKAVF